MHWVPYSNFCTPCKFNFDIIMKFETLEVSSTYPNLGITITPHHHHQLVCRRYECTFLTFNRNISLTTQYFLIKPIWNRNFKKVYKTETGAFYIPFK